MTQPTKNRADEGTTTDGQRCRNCGAAITRRETGILSMSIATRCPSCDAPL